MKVFLKRFFPIYNQIRTILRLRKKVNGNNNKINIRGILSSKCQIKISGNNNIVTIGNSTKIYKMKIEIAGDNNTLFIGSNCRLNNDWWCIGGNNCKIVIGDYCTTEGVHIAALEDNSKVIIGKDSMMSGNIEMRTSDSHSVIDADTQQRINYAKDINIGEHVWIGSRASILKGVTIGDNSIIATGSIVTKGIINNCIASGIPAKIVKTNITWDRQRL